MPSNRVVKIRSSGDSASAREMREGIAAIQAEQKVSPAFPPAVEEAAAAAAADPRLPDLDRTDIELVTIDPESARDLDQAMHIERDPDHGGYVVHYAIADVAAFVTPGDPVDVEAHRRGETLYGADSKVPLHPTVLSEGAASLLPDEVRPALLWTIKVDETGEGIDVEVERALVRSRAKLSYEAVQADLDAGRASELVGLLKEVGELRLAREAARGGVSLPLPEQELVEDGDGHWRLEFRRLTPVETWNAQISLLTGMAAASLMVYARVGILRTLPPADPHDVQRLHRTARALGIEWPAEQLYPDFIRTLDPGRPTHAAMVVACTRLLRGAGYVTFNGELPEQAQHSALASEYAHVTAPLRRLADRYAGEVCVALCAGTEVPDWVVTAMAELPDTMTSSGRRANQYENAVVDLCEAELLHDRVGQTFSAVVVDIDEKDKLLGDITIQDPAIEATVTGQTALHLGEQVSVELVQADPASRSVEFRLA